MTNPLIEANNVVIGNKSVLTGSEAIEYATKNGRTVNKFPDDIVGPIFELSVEDASDAIECRPSLIDHFWVEVA